MTLLTGLSLAAMGGCGDETTPPTGQTDGGTAGAGGDAGGGDGVGTGDNGPVGDTPGGDGTGNTGEIGQPCDAAVDCDSGLCIPGVNGNICSAPCGGQDDCPALYECQSIIVATQSISACVPVDLRLCLLCNEDADCGTGACLDLDNEGRCSYACSVDDECPTGFECVIDDQGQHAGKWCQPVTKSCTCMPSEPVVGDNAQRTCSKSAGPYTCFGVQACKPNAGWTACAAPEPTDEICDGLDNDCNGVIDDAFKLPVGEPCVNDVPGVGVCEGTYACLGGAGLVCQGQTPEPEICDGIDNNCNGEFDEGFKNDEGEYVSDEHCGGCGINCLNSIPNGTGQCSTDLGAPLCVVAECDEGFTQLGLFNCPPITDLSCQVCVDDEQCIGGVCATQPDGTKGCIMPCATGADCQDGYTCESFDPGSGADLYCVPNSGDCSCTEDKDGTTRTCSIANDEGTCFGVQTCFGGAGWTACSASTPGVEICDGFDNDCNGLVDEVEQGTECENAVPGVGVCTGTNVCLGVQGLTCQGPTPEAELCDFKDNDCDGKVDEDFRDPQGFWTLDEHCGTCGNDCNFKIENGTGICGGDQFSPVCIVDTCDDGYVKINDFQCVPIFNVTCNLCDSDADCFGGVCTSLDPQDPQVCLGICDESCGEGFECQNIDGADRCVPVTGSCSCNPLNDGAVRNCSNSVEGVGSCIGQQTCDAAAGWSVCNAPAPTAEICDGIDNDCNGIFDDLLAQEGTECDNTNAFGTCLGQWLCTGQDGWVCQGQVPEEDICDFKDNNCDGVVDEAYLDPEGKYAQTEHCGACNNDCSNVITNGTGVCNTEGAAICVVGECNPPYVKLNDFQCGFPPDVSCSPCQDDSDCFDGNCIALDGQQVCVQPCLDGGTGCKEGYACSDIGGGVDRCVPVTNSCLCIPEFDGQTRLCKVTNEFGTCLGQETCNAAAGWEGCNAGTPEMEICDGVDNDCNGLADDGLEQGGPCDITNANGTCVGISVCQGAAGWGCIGQTPAAESCDFQDNDCDGLIDEDFKEDVAGTLYFTLDDHCGTCGNDCETKILNGTGQCGGENDNPVCIVESCDPPNVQITPFQCGLPPDVGCTTCTDDSDCFGGSCLLIDNKNVCAEPCDDGCNDGFACQSVTDAGGSTVDRCIPTTGSCECNSITNGATRICPNTNEFGTCFGFQTCDATVGWSTCDAPPPAPETCDGADNDCDGSVDEELVETGSACTNDNGFGSCPGTTICAGPQGFICQGPTPSEDICDFQDNDCDGDIDEAFTAADGTYTLIEHCGTCNNNCTNKFTNGTGTCSASSGSPGCVVESCNPPYVKLNDFQCGLPPDNSCQPCNTDSDCPGGTCYQLYDSKACVVPCAGGTTCQDGYSCTDIGGGVERCVPDTNSCLCNDLTDGQVRTCKAENAFGTCFGSETCDAAVGWVGCDAPPPVAEICNGFDDNCNGFADDGVTAPATPCEETNGFGTCSGDWQCTDVGGGTIDWACNAPTPASDACDFIDNDCDGLTDEAYRDGGGNGDYVHPENCGSCGVSCLGTIPNATSTCVKNAEGNPQCVVESCNPGFYQVGALSCLPVVDSTCQPCQTDANCPTPGDTCVDLGDGSFCGRDCSAGSLHGTTCPSGYSCNDLGGGVQQCLPDTGSCSCATAADVGNTRTCVNSNAFGTCFGTQTCQASGWTPCPATTPGVEICDGVDNNCNAVVDDVPGRGDPCDLTNSFGTCVGVQDCVAGGGDALQCVGQVPAAESCNYIDDDCNGTTDDPFPTLFDGCEVGVGGCTRIGFNECNGAGTDVQCNATPGDPEDEVCNSIDDDCNGVTDDDPLFADNGKPCTVGLGICQRNGVAACDPNDPTAASICNAVPGDPNPAELCDFADDDCDGEIDEDFTDGNGKYIDDDNCGTCNNDCSNYWSPSSGNANAFCDSAPAIPVCDFNCVPGAEDADGIPDNGCELVIDPQAIYTSTPANGGQDGTDCGAWDTPCATIGYAISQAITFGRTKVFVSAGAYNESVNLVNGISLLGGFNPVSWYRDEAVNLTAIFGNTPTGHRKAVIAESIEFQPTIFEGFVVYGQTATGAGENSYAMWVNDSDENLIIRKNVFWAGNGGPGTNGTNGDDGLDGQSGFPGVGARDIGPVYCAENCTAAHVNFGGIGGKRFCTDSTQTVQQHGGDGATATCPDWDEAQNLCDESTCPLAGQTPALPGGAGYHYGVQGAGGPGGQSGFDGTIDGACDGASCPCVNPTTAGPIEAFDGFNGNDGADGSAGAACYIPGGSVNGGEWSSGGATDGTDGQHGQGGGGGGAGGGVENRSPNFGVTCPYDGTDLGGSGGGGGAGGCSGTYGTAGTSGGGSFALFVVFEALPTPTTTPQVEDNTFNRGFGGGGGNGGVGGSGGGGGNGGAGGAAGTPGENDWCAGGGGSGGEGGNGGAGGGGGAGCGGVSYSLYAYGYGQASNLAAWKASNSFPAGGGPGPGGKGGASVGNPGADGLDGVSGDTNF